MAEGSLSASEITTLVILSTFAVILLVLIIYKVLTLRNRQRQIRYMEQGNILE
jgi:hypothetical protein